MADKRKVLFIFNPHSGKAQIKTYLLSIIDIMVKAGYEVNAYPTQAQTDAIHKVEQEAANYDLVVCSGGDGTLDEAVTGLMKCGAKVPLGYIPAGSTNDFASSFGIPKDMPGAAEIAVRGIAHPCDVGKFNDDYFVYIAAFGWFTDVSYKTSQALKNAMGHAAYLLESVKSLGDMPAHKLKVVCGDKCIEDTFVYGMITNSASIGGIKDLAGKDVRLDDGLFEVTLVRSPKGPIEFGQAVATLVNIMDNTDMVYSFKASELRITSEEAVPWTLDGEFGGEWTEVEISNLCRAIDIMTPSGEGERSLDAALIGE